MIKSFRNIVFLLLLIGSGNINAQESRLHRNYIGLLPSLLVEPYDTINAIEVNTIPFLFERRVGVNLGVGFQFRPIVNYRFYKVKSGISQVGATVVVNKYFLGLFKDDFWLKPQLGTYYTYTFNRLDKIQTMTFGIEPGAFMLLSDHLSLSLCLQPGINFYPDDFSKEFVESESGFKSHFGFIFHVGYNF